MYQRFIKRWLDILCALLALIGFCWLYLILIVLVRIKLGRPVIFRQPRPGKTGEDGAERIFMMYKFRTMTEEKDENGEYRPDEVRLTKFGSKLRDWSLDEIPEAVNILKGDMSVIGPRPLLVRDMVFMTDAQRQRHCVRPGLSGLAQVNGRNAITWEAKLAYDLEYIRKITFWGDVRIVFQTLKKVFEREGTGAEDEATTEDFGDALLQTGKVSLQEYSQKQEEAKKLLREAGYDG